MYLLYRFDSDEKTFNQVRAANSFYPTDAKHEDQPSIDPVQAFQHAVNQTSLSPEWKEDIDKLELEGDQKIGQVMPLPGYDRVEFPFVIGITKTQQQVYLINTKSLLPQMLIRLSVDSRNDAMRQFYFTKTYRALSTPETVVKGRESSLDSRFGNITLSPIRKERHEI